MLLRFLPEDTPEARFAAERMMMARLGASTQEVEALREQMERVEMYT